MKTRIVKPCGFLIINNFETFFLLSPEPVVKDSWQDNGTYRFVCTPSEPIDIIVAMGKDNPIYDYARHVVTNSFAIEYRADMTPIDIRVLTDIDLTVTEFKETEELKYE